MTIEHDELGKILPQKGKMFLIGRISDAEPENWKIESETKITEDFMFYDKAAEGVPNYACIEIIAQTVAALMGLYAKEKNVEPNMGMILSVSKLHFDFDKIAAGQTIAVKAVREASVDNVQSFAAQLFLDSKEAGSGKITAMEITDGK